ncbi:hypothetical protein [Phenylobacterium sp.]|jgi:hypothetical protein
MTPASPHILRKPAQPRPSPNRRRAVARMVFWNLVMAFAVVALPILF